MEGVAHASVASQPCAVNIMHLFAGLAALAAAAAGRSGGNSRCRTRLRLPGQRRETGSIDVSGRSSGMSHLQQDAIIGQAIAGHEMRRP